MTRNEITVAVSIHFIQLFQLCGIVLEIPMIENVFLTMHFNIEPLKINTVYNLCKCLSQNKDNLSKSF